MARVTAHIGKDRYKTEIHSENGSLLLADEPVDMGGQNLGFAPSELLAAGLGACTSITLRMYADRKEWPLEGLETEIELTQEGGKSTFTRKIKLLGPLDETQKARLLAIANACPVHKILTGQIGVDTTLV